MFDIQMRRAKGHATGIEERTRGRFQNGGHFRCKLGRRDWPPSTRWLDPARRLPIGGPDRRHRRRRCRFRRSAIRFSVRLLSLLFFSFFFIFFCRRRRRSARPINPSVRVVIRVGLGSTGFLLGFTGFYWVVLGVYWVLLGFIGFYWVLFGLQDFYWF